MSLHFSNNPLSVIRGYRDIIAIRQHTVLASSAASAIQDVFLVNVSE